MRKIIIGLSTLIAVTCLAQAPLAIQRNPLTTNGTVNVMNVVRGVTMPIFRNIPFGETRICIEGDSLSTGYGGQKPWPSILATNTAGVFAWGTNAAHPGETLVQMAAEYAAEIQPYKPSGGTNAILIIWGGINDMANTDWPDVLSRLTNYWAAAKADGFIVIGSTITDSVNMPIGNRHMLTRLNKEIRRAAFAQIDGLMDPAAVIGDNEDPLYYIGDKVHFSSAGAEVLARLAEQAIYSPRNTRASEPGKYTSVSQLTASGFDTTTTVRGTYWMGRFFGLYPIWVSELISGPATAWGTYGSEFRLSYAKTGSDFGAVPSIALNESRVRITTNLWNTGMINTNGMTLLSSSTIPDSLLVGEVGKVNYTLCNIDNIPVLLGTNADTGALTTNSFADFTSAATSSDTLIVPPASLLVQSTAVTWFTASWYLGHRFQVTAATKVRYANLRIDTASGNISVGLFKMVGTSATLVATTGVIACPAAGQVKLDLGVQVLPTGEYMLLFWANNTTIKLWHGNAGSGMETSQIAANGLASTPPTNSFTSMPYLSGRFLTGFTLTGK